MAPRATGSPIGDGTGGTKVINCCRHTPEAPTSTSGRQAACSRICIAIRLEANYQALNAPLTRQNNGGRNWDRTSDPYRVKVTSFPKRLHIVCLLGEMPLYLVFRVLRIQYVPIGSNNVLRAGLGPMERNTSMWRLWRSGDAWCLPVFRCAVGVSEPAEIRNGLYL